VEESGGGNGVKARSLERFGAIDGSGESLEKGRGGSLRRSSNLGGSSMTSEKKVGKNYQ